MIVKKFKLPPSQGSEKIVKRFLWIPEEIGGDVRWLETIKWRYMYHNGEWFLIERIK